MEDQAIVQLFFDRNQLALQAAGQKYGKLCRSIAGNILGNQQDAEELVNDTMLQAWNSIPPQRPQNLAAYLAKIARNLSFNRYKKSHAQKRGGGQMALVLTELEDCLPAADTPETEWDRKQLSRTLQDFVGSLPRPKRDVFICRYWYAQSNQEIAKRFGMSESNVAVTLNRLRAQLKLTLQQKEAQT